MIHLRAGSDQKGSEMREFFILCLVLAALISSVSCRKQQVETARSVDIGDAKAAEEKLAEADKLYGQREDLAKIRQAVSLARQAQVANYGSYEAAWKLAEFDYYLDRKSTRLNSSHIQKSRMPSSA